MQYTTHTSAAASQIEQLQQQNNELAWSKQELAAKAEQFEAGDEYSFFSEQRKEGDALIVALRAENAALQAQLDAVTEVVERHRSEASHLLDASGTCGNQQFPCS
jgi:chromosome segregation ATPase